MLLMRLLLMEQPSLFVCSSLANPAASHVLVMMANVQTLYLRTAMLGRAFPCILCLLSCSYETQVPTRRKRGRNNRTIVTASRTTSVRARGKGKVRWIGWSKGSYLESWPVHKSFLFSPGPGTFVHKILPDFGLELRVRPLLPVSSGSQAAKEQQEDGVLPLIQSVEKDSSEALRSWQLFSSHSWGFVTAPTAAARSPPALEPYCMELCTQSSLCIWQSHSIQKNDKVAVLCLKPVMEQEPNPAKAYSCLLSPPNPYHAD